MIHHDGNSPSELEDLAEIPCHGSEWKLKHNGQWGSAKQSWSKCTNWYHPFLWSVINGETKWEWSAVTKRNIVHWHALAGWGQLGILVKYPEIVNEIKVQLQGLHTSGLDVNVLIACSIMLAIIKHHTPDLLIMFKCSKVSVLLTY